MLFDSIDEDTIFDIYNLPLDMVCIIYDSKYYFKSTNTFSNLPTTKSVERDTLFFNFFNFDFDRLKKPITQYIENSYYNEPQKKDIKNIEEILEEIPFIFGELSVFFIIYELTLISVHYFYDQIETFKDHKSSYDFELSKMIIEIFDYFSIDYMHTKIHDKSCSEELDAFYNACVKNLMNPFIELGRHYAEGCILQTWWDIYTNIESIKRECISILADCKKITFPNITKKERENEMKKIIHQKLGNDEIIIESINFKGHVASKANIKNLRSLFIFILQEATKNTHLRCCPVCNKVFSQKSNNQIYCSSCRDVDPYSKFSKYLDTIDPRPQNLQVLIDTLGKYHNELICHEIIYDIYLYKIQKTILEYDDKKIKDKLLQLFSS